MTIEMLRYTITMPRKVWDTTDTFDDLMIEHCHPGCSFVPIGGFGDFHHVPEEIILKSDEAVKQITGKSTAEHNRELVAHLLDQSNSKSRILD